MVPNVTMLDLVTTVAAYARTDDEIVATVVALVNGGKVRLCGNFAGARIDLANRSDRVDRADRAAEAPRGGQGEEAMERALVPGVRIRSIRPITHPGGILRRAAEGTVRTRRENLGRQLLTVDFDSGERLVLFPHEIELVTGLAA